MLLYPMCCSGAITGKVKEPFMVFLHAPFKKKIPPFWASADARHDTLLDITRIQWVTGFVLSADLGHTVCGLHI